MFLRIILLLYIRLNIVSSLVSLPVEEEEIKPFLHHPEYSQISEDFDCLIIEDGERPTVGKKGPKKRIATQTLWNAKSKQVKKETEVKPTPGKDTPWSIYYKLANNEELKQVTSSCGPQVKEFIDAILGLGEVLKINKNEKHSEDITVRRRDVINLATSLLNGQELFGALRLWFIGILSDLTSNYLVKKDQLHQSDLDSLIPSRAELELEIFYGPQLPSMVQKVFSEGGRDNISQNVMREGIARVSTLLSMKQYLKTYKDPQLDSIEKYISDFINLGVPFRQEKVSRFLEDLFMLINHLMYGEHTHMQKRIGFHLLLHMEQHDGLSRVKIRSFVQTDAAYAGAFRGLYTGLLHRKLPSLETVLWTINANKPLSETEVYNILHALSSPEALLAEKGNLFRVLNLTSVIHPDVREVVNAYLDKNPERTVFIFQMLRLFYTNLEPKNENPKDLKDDIEEKGLQLVMPDIRKPLEAKLILANFNGIHPANFGIVSRLTKVDVRSRRTQLENLLMNIFHSVRLSTKDPKSQHLLPTDPRIEYILHLIALKNDDRNLSLCLYSKEEPVFQNMLQIVCAETQNHEFEKFNEFITELETKINILLTSLTLGLTDQTKSKKNNPLFSWLTRKLF